jgi:hypothetical protein
MTKETEMQIRWLTPAELDDAIGADAGAGAGRCQVQEFTVSKQTDGGTSPEGARGIIAI